MKKQYSAIRIAVNIWFCTNAIFGLGWLSCILVNQDSKWMSVSLLATFVSSIASSPVIIILRLVLGRINKKSIDNKIQALLFSCFIITATYGVFGGVLNLFIDFKFDNIPPFIIGLFIGTVSLFACTALGIGININSINSYFRCNAYLPPNYLASLHTNTKTSNIMNTTNDQQPNEQTWENEPVANKSNNTMWKAIITGFLILVMLIPTFFVASLITEREERQKTVVKEVTSKWATQQTVTSPYIYLPYNTFKKSASGKDTAIANYLLLLPENLSVNSKIFPEQRPRSIYKVLLYKSNITANGDFVITLPKNIGVANLQLADAKICVGLSDFKGIEERVTINIAGTNYELTPGLPVNDIDSAGLSAPINIATTAIGASIKFNVTMKLKGSERLYFTPLAGNSNFTMQSNWNNPSFDGNVLPSERTVNDSGFIAKWAFNKASLPFSTTLTNFKLDKNNLAFGVVMVQPADQYAKTTRSVKYAILIIGLTFALFFIIELMQKKALHPVQYVLVGLALIIFYTLLLSISEFVLFDYAYLMAATATVLLIMFYAKGHFQSWKTACIFGGILSALYGFIFTLIRLEDTALLVGSIGLFIVLALVMYASRKINWYNPSLLKN